MYIICMMILNKANKSSLYQTCVSASTLCCTKSQCSGFSTSTTPQGY